MRPGAAAGKECQSRPGEGAVRQERSVADAGDRCRRTAGAKQSAEVPEMRTVVVPMQPEDAALRDARPEEHSAQQQPVLALSALLSSMVSQLPVPANPRQELNQQAAAQQRGVVKALPEFPACSHRRQRVSPVQQERRACQLRDDGVGHLHRRSAPVQPEAARPQQRRGDGAPVQLRVQSPELASRAPTAL